MKGRGGAPAAKPFAGNHMNNTVADIIAAALENARRAGAEFADARCLSARSSAIEVQDGRLEKLHATVTEGIGVRALLNGAWGFACANSITKDEIERCAREAVETAGALAGLSEKSAVAEAAPVTATVEIPCVRPPADVPSSEKIAKAKDLEAAARKHDKRIVNTSLTYRDSQSEMLVVNSRGTRVLTTGPRAVVMLRVVAAEDGLLQRTFEVVGRREGYEAIEALDPAVFSAGAAQRAINLLHAAPPPSGRFPVIFDPSIAGLLVHEAFGHNSEADHVWSGESIIAGKLGEQIASPLVTIIDDPTMKGAWGHFPYDDEGVPARPKTLVENGVLKSFLHSLETAALMNAEPNGSARVENHQYKPIVRMSNTCFKPGGGNLRDMIAGISRGVLVGRSIGGYVATEKGQFTCHAGESWMIRNGEKCELLRDVAVSGLTLEALAGIEGVSSEFELSMPGTCGKQGQGVPVDDGGPYLFLKELVVGGAGGE